MVESNHAEERLARVEQTLERLQRETTKLQVITKNLVVSVEALAMVPPTKRNSRRR